MEKITDQVKKELVPLTNGMTQEEIEDAKIAKEVMDIARKDFQIMKKTFKFTEVEFLAAFTQGYLRGIEKGQSMFDEMNEKTK